MAAATEEGHLGAFSWTDGADSDAQSNSVDTSEGQSALQGAKSAPHHPSMELGKPSGLWPRERTAQEAVDVSIEKLAQVSAHSPKAILLLLDG